ncbi:hypothetical protein DMB66_19700 [Actinoplanes sp. ATCC 53533]|uniref:sigma-70 family RNA polymerase sigma factor n=1 Tax=Actinoplanes sp. ATCC 53533 TaxID=1288362 RepID=UPI000F7808FE|nr:sigma-70 family RNA polymerase sigma factor [Actinoplanes sp. ATCC 53533]RSM64548.1 hypothetical protein DMB66_19700 [Actinoplanes sp. ATCC 53533]
MRDDDAGTVYRSGRSDADLALAATGGDRSALGEIYDRFAPRIHSLAVRQLRDREAAADVTQDTFVLAAQRLPSLREPDRLGPWLFAIARHQIIDHIRRERRHVVTDRIEDYDIPAEGSPGYDRVRAEELRTLLTDTRAGLDNRDRLVLELAYGEQLAGADIAAALGIGEDNAHQLLSRARQRLRTSLGALLVARRGRRDCPDLAGLLEGWNGTFSTVWRKRVARHVDTCDICATLEQRVLSPAALSVALPVLALPADLRERVLSSSFSEPTSATAGTAPTTTSTPTREAWREDGFPPGADGGLDLLATGRARTWPRKTLPLIAGAAMLSIVLMVAAALAGTSSDPLERASGGQPSGGTTAVPTTRSDPSTTVSASPLTPSKTPDSGNDPPPAPATPRLVVKPGGDGDPVALSTGAAVLAVAVSHTGRRTVDISLDAPDVLQVTPVRLSVPRGGSAQVELSWRAAAARGADPVTLTVRAAGFETVTITVVQKRKPVLRPRLEANGVLGPLWAPGNLSDSFTLNNDGDATADWVATPTPAGLTVSPRQGRLEPGESITLKVAIPRTGPPTRSGGQVVLTAAGSPDLTVAVPWIAPG